MRKRGFSYYDTEFQKENWNEKKKMKKGSFLRKKRKLFFVFFLFLFVGAASFYVHNNFIKNKSEDSKSDNSWQTEQDNSIEISKDTGNKMAEESTQESSDAEKASQNQEVVSAGNDSSIRENSTDDSKENSPVNQANAEENDFTGGANIESTEENPLESTAVINNGADPIKGTTAKAVKVRGIYISGPRAGSEKYMKDLTNLVETTELNAMVIDIKNDMGEITYKMDNPVAEEINANRNYIRNIRELVKELKDKDIYLIARIVAFKDPLLAEKKPKLSIKLKDGTVFRDRNGESWVNPYNREVWDYLIAVSREAADLGFDEIQFDYIRFSTDKAIKNADFGEESNGISKTEIITEFTKYAYETLKPLGVFVSADVFGTIIDSQIDAGIVGQDYNEMANYLDYICPMIYPSHYQNGSYGIEYPDMEPYQLILKALEKSQEALTTDQGSSEKAIVRSWLQDFTAVWLKNNIKYGAKEIKAQIQAVYDAGYEEWILWNGSNNYTKSGLIAEEYHE